MKMYKRFFSVLLVCCLLVGILPSTVLAANTTTTGTCGDSLTWTLSDTGTLTISGNGEMASFSGWYDSRGVFVTDIPWYDARSRITSVIIEEGVTGIGVNAFYRCSNLSRVDIANTVTIIEQCAFDGCTCLSTIIIPDSVASIEYQAFKNCTGLSNIIIPASVTNIGYMTFEGCSALRSAGPIGSGANIEFGWTAEIPDEAFSCSDISIIDFPNGIYKIGARAFYGCDKLREIIVPNSVVSVGSDAFGGETLEHIVIPSSVSCDGSIFGVCPKLKSAGPLGGNYNIEFGWIQEIPDYAFCGMGTVTAGKNFLETVVLPDSLNKIGDSAFEDCTELKKIEIPNGVTEIGDSAFRNCKSLKTIKIPSSLKTIGVFVFGDCYNLRNVEISDGVQSLEGASFGFANFTSIFLPKSIKRIANAFGHSDLTDVYYAGSEDDWSKIEIISDYNDSLKDATIHYNIPNPYNAPSSGGVSFLNSYDTTTRNVSFGSNRISPYTLAETADLANISLLLKKYVLVTMDADDVLTVNSIEPVESRIGTVKAEGNHSITVSDIEYPVRDDLILGIYAGKEVLYHLYSGTVVGITILEEKSGTLEEWDSTTGIATIDGRAYPTNYMTDLSFLADIDQTVGKKVSYFIADTSGYTPLLKLTRDNSSKPDDSMDGIAVFSTEKSLTVGTGEEMWLGFGLIKDNEFVLPWRKMAVAVSDPTVISLSDYEETEYGYSLQITGKKPGATNVSISDSETGAYRTLVITVKDSYASTYSYAIDNMETFYPNNGYENHLETNIYNLNGLYVTDYKCDTSVDGYNVSFKVYNSRYHYGAVDIYDKDGKWIDCEQIGKYSMPSSLWTVGEQAYFLISNAFDGTLITYKQAASSKETAISIEVPLGGYFTISNNFAESPGTFLFNSCEIVYDATMTLVDASLKKDMDVTAFSKLVKDEIAKDKTLREKFITMFLSTAKKEISSYTKKLISGDVEGGLSDISSLLENMLSSLNLSWKHLLSSAAGIGESVFEDVTGPVGVALKGCFAISKAGNSLVQVYGLAQSTDRTYATVYSSIDEGYINQHGVIVNTSGNMDAEAVLQVFRVSNNNAIEVILDKDFQTPQHELYNICFVKNDQLVQPSGKVEVRIPVPAGMKGESCVVYRQESDGRWTILDAHKSGNYLVFETDHFSLYAVVGDADQATLLQLPQKTTYELNDVLSTDGMILNVGGSEIKDGFICEPTVFSEIGKQIVTVKYGSAIVTFDVVVTKADGPAAPSGLVGVAPTTVGVSDGKITGVDTTMEYSSNSDFTSKTTCTGTEITGLSAGTYYVRVTETSTTKAGAYATVVVPDSAALTYSISLDKTGTYTFLAANEGYTAQTPVTVTVTNTGTGATGALTVALSGTDASSFTLSKANTADIEAGDSDTFTLVPNTGLIAKTYTAAVIVSGGNSISATFDVSFTVNAPGGTVATPVLSAASSFTGTKSITITCATDGASIYYTTDGSTPTVSSTPYTAAFTISATTTVKAIAVKGGMTDSEVVSATYTRTSSGGGGSYTPTTYAISAVKAENGSVSVSPANAAEGTTVNITVIPDEGYELDKLTVTDASSKEITATEKGGKYTFTMPASKVTVNATFNEIDKHFENPYTDVMETDWFYEAVKHCAGKGYFNGTGNNLYSPNGIMTRAMFATVLYRIAGEPEVMGDNPFKDVEDGGWHSDAVIWAASNGIINGYGGGIFGTNDPVTREQMVVLFWRYNGSPTVDNADRSNFTDTDKISGWAQQAMEWAVSVGVISGKGNGILDPDGTATRAEVAQIVMNYDTKVK